ncbi:cyanamide hydratase [Phlyctema vagabunda]|uniref:Cyanamide hydratase n=1 Tax=Phlyctema vagabunda TaxID=108571 RepID=A0ABR4PBJ7_9HELO
MASINSLKSTEREEAIASFGWPGVLRDLDELLKSHAPPTASPPRHLPISAFHVPETQLARRVHEYARVELSTPTFHHCMRVFYYGQAILTHLFPTWSTPSFNETYFLTCLLHDIGTTEKNLHATLLSFEFYGGFLALDALRREGAPQAQAESVAEAVIRHQDIGHEGVLSRIGALIQLATIFDNMGGNPDIVNTKTIEDVVALYPRLKWSSCFAATIREENSLKSWSNSRRLGERAFPEGVENNSLMAPYDG